VLGTKTANVDGVSVVGSASVHYENVKVCFCDSGFVSNNNVGHCYHIGCESTNNYYGVYIKLNTFDYFFDDCKINGNTFANFAAPADQGFAAMTIRDSHIGFAPYGIYQEATPANQGKPKIFLQDVIIEHGRFEAIGNAAILTDAQQDASNASISSNVHIRHPGFSWNAGYKIAARTKNFAVDLSQTDRLIEIIGGANPFIAGATNTYRVKVAGGDALIVVDTQVSAAQIQIDSGGFALIAGAFPIANGGGPVTLGDINLKSGTYFNFSGSNIRLGGLSGTQIFLDMNGVLTGRDSGNGFAQAFNLTHAGALSLGVKAQTLAVAGAVTIDASLGNAQIITLGANASSSSIISPGIGQNLTIEWLQDGTGSRTYAWPANCKFAGGAAPAASVTANYKDSVTFRYDGTNWTEISRAVGIH
jgi:hypothetical protein